MLEGYSSSDLADGRTRMTIGPRGKGGVRHARLEGFARYVPLAAPDVMGCVPATADDDGRRSR
jgi:hypothetical protein